MSSTADRPEFGARSMAFELVMKYIIPIHIKRYDNNIILTGDVENIAIRPEMMPYSPASYTALNAVLRVLYGYI